MKTDIEALTIRPEKHRDYKDIVSLVLRSFKEGTDYSDGSLKNNGGYVVYDMYYNA